MIFSPRFSSVDHFLFRGHIKVGHGDRASRDRKKSKSVAFHALSTWRALFLIWRQATSQFADHCHAAHLGRFLFPSHFESFVSSRKCEAVGNLACFYFFLIFWAFVLEGWGKFGRFRKCFTDSSPHCVNKKKRRSIFKAIYLVIHICWKILKWIIFVILSQFIF